MRRPRASAIGTAMALSFSAVWSFSQCRGPGETAKEPGLVVPFKSRQLTALSVSDADASAELFQAGSRWELCGKHQKLGPKSEALFRALDTLLPVPAVRVLTTSDAVQGTPSGRARFTAGDEDVELLWWRETFDGIAVFARVEGREETFLVDQSTIGVLKAIAHVGPNDAGNSVSDVCPA